MGKLKTIFVFWLVCGANGIFAQNHRLGMSMEEVIQTAREQSLQAMLAKHNFLVSYWSFRSYKAQYLPSLNLTAELGNYDRSLNAVQNSETGEINYVDNNTLRNSIGLDITQNVAFTGGTIALNSSLERLDQYAPGRKIRYNSQPVYISYNQPIKAYNSLKWEKRIEPKRYEMAKRVYLESMEDVTATAVAYFFDLLIAQKDLAAARQSLENTKMSYRIAQERFKIGTMSKNELLQLKLTLLNSENSIRENELKVQTQMIKLRNFLGYNETVNITLEVPGVPNQILLDVDDVMAKMDANSSFVLDNEITKLEAEQNVARTKANTGLQASVYARFGLNQVGSDFKSAYRSPIDYEQLGLSLKLPILDWGLRKGQVKVAESRDKVTEMNIEQSINKQRENVLLKVLQFNMQGQQCAVSAEADTVGRQGYEATRERFVNGLIGVLELNTAQENMDAAGRKYLQNLSDYWLYYYGIQKLTLFNYRKGTMLTEDFDKLSGEVKVNKSKN